MKRVNAALWEVWRRLVVGCAAMLLQIGVWGCGHETDTPRPPDVARDATAVLDASLPRADRWEDTAADAFSVAETKGAADIAVGPDTDPLADAWVLPEESIETCADFLSCMSNCPPEVASCVDPCDDAMTRQAAAEVLAFLNCASHNHCRDQDCLMRHCPGELRTCLR